MAVTEADLGPFAPEQGTASRAASLGALAGASAALVAVYGVVTDVAGITAYRSRPVAVPLAVAAIGLSLFGLWSISTAGRRGASTARWGLILGAAGGAAAYVHTAVLDGTLHPEEFGRAYFDRGIIGAIWYDLLKAMVNTLKLAVLAEGLGIVIGLLVATMEVSKRRWLRFPAVAYVDVVRGLPLLMLLFLIGFGLPKLGLNLPTFVAVVAGLTINASAYIAEIFRAGIQSVERGQMDAARSLGMPYPTAMLFVIIPQAARRVIPPLTSEFIALIKDTSLVSVLGTTVASRELFTAARQSASSTFSATPFMAASIVYLAMTLPLTRVVNRLERRVTRAVAPRRSRQRATA